MKDLYYSEATAVSVAGNIIEFPDLPLPIEVLEELYRMKHDLAFGYSGDGDGFEVTTSTDFKTPSGKVLREIVLENENGIIIYTLLKQRVY